MGSACGCCKEEEPPYVSSPRRESDAMHRFNKASISTINPLTLIDGYQNEPLVSLEEALKPFYGEIDGLSGYIQEAKSKCHYPSEHNLSRDESAAIYIYTMRWGSGCLYDRLHGAWSSKNPAALKPWFKYLKLFRTALDKLPNAKTEVWQGIAYDEHMKDKLSSKSLPLFSSMGSCSTSEHEMRDYLHEKGDKKTILIGYESVNGKTVSGYTASNSKEVIIWPGAKVIMAKVYENDGDNGSLIFHLTAKSEPPPPKTPIPKTPIDIKHFVCLNNNCGNRCRGNHETHHCYGFAFISHTCQHHCGPTHECFACGKHLTHLRECSKCESRYCDTCCLK